MNSNINWNDTIKKEAEGINGEDFGEVQDVTNGFVLVQRGIINKEKFLIPQELTESYDGDTVRFGISEDEMLKKYGEGSKAFTKTTNTESTSSLETETAQDAIRDEMTVPLTEEKLDVSKDVYEDQATISKEPVTETKTIEIPMTHEEISIEKGSPPGGERQVASEGPIKSREEISIPLKKEKAEVSKTPYVKEEVVINKKPVTETKKVTEQVTSERLAVED